MIEGNALRERRIAQCGEPVQRDIPQVNRSEFLAGQSHDISPCDSRYVNGVYTRDAFVTKVRRSLIATEIKPLEPALASTEPPGRALSVNRTRRKPARITPQRPKPYKDSRHRRQSKTGRRGPKTFIDDNGQPFHASCCQIWDPTEFRCIRPGLVGLSHVGPVQAARTPGLRLRTTSTGGLVAAKDQQPPPVREVACHAEQLAQPGSIDGGLAIDGEEVCLALELGNA
jgi:hypothetical protein